MRLPAGVASDTSVGIHFTPTSCPSSSSPSAADLTSIGNAKILNAHYIRFDVWWDSFEPNQNVFSACALAYYQSISSDIQAQGLKAIAVLGTQEPDWVTYACYGGVYPGVEIQALKQYSGNVSRGLGQWISFYQLGNELDAPINPHERRCGSSQVQYLTATAQGIQQGTTSPYQTIVNAYADNTSFNTACNAQGGWYSDLTSYLNGAGSYIDVIAIDHYPGTYCQGSWAADGFLSSLQGLATYYGKGYAITETGFTTYQNSQQNQDAWANQALTSIYGFALPLSNGNSPLLFISWYRLTDVNEAGQGAYECCFGLQDGQGVNKAAFSTVASYFHEFIGYPVTFVESDFPPGLVNWCVTFNNINECSTSPSITFNSQPGTYPYSVTSPNCGSGCQYLAIHPSGVIMVSFASFQQNVQFLRQYQLTLSYSLVGGGQGYAPPSVAFVSNGTSEIVALGTSPTSIFVDSGTNWQVGDTLPNSNSNERWWTGQSTGGAASAPLSLNLVYFNQYQISFSYSVTSGGSPTPPELAATTSGTQFTEAVSQSGIGFWLDAGTSYSLTNPLQGSGAAERWIALNGSDGSVDSAQSIMIDYKHQYSVQMNIVPVSSGSINASSGWYNAGARVQITVTPQSGFSFSTWTSNNPSLSITGTTSSFILTVGGPGHLTANFSPIVATSTNSHTRPTTSMSSTTSTSESSNTQGGMTSNNSSAPGTDGILAQTILGVPVYAIAIFAIFLVGFIAIAIRRWNRSPSFQYP
jgi:Divergent InlB B-repeat domain